MLGCTIQTNPVFYFFLNPKENLIGPVGAVGAAAALAGGAGVEGGGRGASACCGDVSVATAGMLQVHKQTVVVVVAAIAVVVVVAAAVVLCRVGEHNT